MGGPRIITALLQEEAGGSKSKIGDVIVEAEVQVMPFENGERSFEPKNAGGFLELEKAKKWIPL